jgi:HTH-type transcriptional regulator/antitoxin MqsA
MREPCYECGGEAVLAREEQVVRLGQRSTTVEGEFMRCSSCGEEYFLPGQMEALQMAAAARMRREEGLLVPEAIREIRENMGLSQADFEKLLGVGPKTVVRWERGTVFQSKAADTLIRILQRHPQVARELARERGMHLAAAIDPLQAMLKAEYTIVAEHHEEMEYPVINFRRQSSAREACRPMDSRIYFVRSFGQTRPEVGAQLMHWSRQKLDPDPEPSPLDLYAAYTHNRLKGLGV